MSLAHANLKALKSKGPVLKGRDASDNCKKDSIIRWRGLDRLPQSVSDCLLGGQLHQQLAWSVPTPGPVQLLVLN